MGFRESKEEKYARQWPAAVHLVIRLFPQDMMLPDLPLWPIDGDFVVDDGESNTWLLMLRKWERKLARNENGCWLLGKRFRHCLNSFLKATFSLGWSAGGGQRVDLNADLPKGRCCVLQVDQCEWLWQISSVVLLLCPVTMLRLQLSGRCTSIVFVCTASEIISWDIHVPLKAKAGNLCKKN